MRFQVSDRGRVGLVSFLLFCAALTLSSYSHKNPNTTKVGQVVISELTRPFSSVAVGTQSSLRGVWDRYIYLIGVSLENEALHQQVETLKQERTKQAEVEAENKRLRELLGLAEAFPHKRVTASVISYDPSTWVRAMTIDRGATEGVEVGNAVTTGGGIVGQVVAVSPHTARVLLITDRSSGVDVLTQESRGRGIIEGRGGYDCELRYVDDADDVKVGDKLVTSGLDGVFPKGLPVGVILSVDTGLGGLFKSIRVRPSAQFSKLEEVIIFTR